MNKTLLISTTLAVCALLAPPVAADPTPAAQLKAAARRAGSLNGRCPVMGKLVTPTGGTATYKSERIAFCCPPCEKKFKADPTRYMDRMRMNPAKFGYQSKSATVIAMREAKAATGASNGRCPVMGNTVKAKGGSVTYRGQHIGFCCPPCLTKFNADPERYMRLMRGDPLAYGYDRPGPTAAELRAARKRTGTANGLCPVLGKKVTVKAGAMRYTGQKIGFCCPDCAANFQQNPKRYMQVLRTNPGVYGYVPAPKSKSKSKSK